MSEQAASLSTPGRRLAWASGVGRWYRRTLVEHRYLSVLILLLLVSAFLSLNTRTFLTSNNLFNVARACSWIAIAAFGESMVIIIGGEDLSVGAVMALAGLISALCLQAGMPVPVAISAGLLTGGAAGWVNGILVGRVKLPSYIITLGTMSIARGLAFGLTGGWPVRDLPPGFGMLGIYKLPVWTWAIPLPVLIMLGLTVLVSLLLGQTVLGRYIYTLGSSERALLVSGVNVVRIRILVYTLCGLLAAVGGLLMTARLGVAAPTAALGYELDVIAAVVIGGTSLFGRQGSVVGVLLGAVLMQITRNGLVLLGFSAYWQAVAIGAMILVAILFDYWQRRKNLE
ncbi:MAG: ABC transporter permease [Anaerolineales bacterium]|nr:ABC transporter permease [Anaerolineales bacterium]